jgi:hypothetical protein
MSDRGEKAAIELKRVITVLNELEARICEAEDALRLSRSNPNDRIGERLERVGVSKASVARIERFFSIFDDQVKALIAEQESAMRQLAAIVEHARKP